MYKLNWLHFNAERQQKAKLNYIAFGAILALTRFDRILEKRNELHKLILSATVILGRWMGRHRGVRWNEVKWNALFVMAPPKKSIINFVEW